LHEETTQTSGIFLTATQLSEIDIQAGDRSNQFSAWIVKLQRYRDRITEHGGTVSNKELLDLRAWMVATFYCCLHAAIPEAFACRAAALEWRPVRAERA
jgi:hypothetical protein